MDRFGSQEEEKAARELAKQQSIKSFDKKAAEMDTNPTLVEVSRAASKVLKEEVLEPQMDVMDHGCGTGMLVLSIADSVHSVLGVDNSPGMISALQAKVDARGQGCNVRGACADLTSPSSLHDANDAASPYPEQFDLVVSTMTLHHIQDIPELLRLLVHHLKLGGKLAVFDFKKSPWSKRFHSTEMSHTVHHVGGFSPEELSGYLSEVGLVDVSCREVHKFSRPAGDDKSVMLEFGLLLAIGTRRQ